MRTHAHMHTHSIQPATDAHPAGGVWASDAVSGGAAAQDGGLAGSAAGEEVETEDTDRAGSDRIGSITFTS